MRIAIVLSVLSALLVTGITPAAAAEVGGDTTGSISGRISAGAAADGTYIGVHVYTAETVDYVTSGYADAEGQYTAGNLPAGSYKLKFFDYNSGHLSQWYGNADNQDSAEVLVLAPGQQLTGIDVTLVEGAAISGQVKAPTGVDLGSIGVTAFTPDGTSSMGYSGLSEDGSFKISGLPAGTYKVQYTGYYSGALEQWYSGAESIDAATPLTLEAGQDRTGIDATLVKGATIGGRVTVPAGIEASSVGVQLRPADGSSSFFRYTSVGQDGTYKFTGLSAGAYKVHFQGNGAGSLDQWYANADSEATASRVSVTASQDLTGIDATLLKAATISGRITAPEAVAVSDVTVNVYTAEGNAIAGYGQINEDGSYRVGGLPAGSYKVEFRTNNSGALEQWHAGAQSIEAATALVLTAGQDLTGIDAILVKGATISGSVTAPAGVDLTSLHAYVYPSEYRGRTWSAQVKTDGSYTVYGLAAGSYKVQFSGYNTGTLTQWHSGAASFETATALALNAGQDLTGIDAAMVTGASISGRVNAPAGVDLSRVQAYLIRDGAWDWDWTAEAQVSTDGTYKFGGLSAGSYKIRFSARGLGALDSWYGDVSTSAEAALIALTDGEAKTNVDATLPKGASISGKMTGPEGVDVTAHTVAVYDADNSRSYPVYADVRTDGSWTAAGLRTGNYKIRYSGYNSGALEQWHENAASMADATSVALAPGQDLTGIEATLVKGGSISGTVTAPAGVSLTSVYVRAVSEAAPHGAAGANVSSDGTYTLKGLPAGTYKLNYYGYNSGALEEWYEDARTSAEATPITLSAAQHRTGVNAALAKGASISGKLTIPEGTPSHSVYISLYKAGETAPFASTYNEFDGSYSFRGIEAGTYKLQFQSHSYTGLIPQQWYSDAASIDTATEVTVTEGQDRTSVDAALKKGASISGRITAPPAVDLGAAQVVATRDGSPDATIASASVGTDGTYTLTGLPAGTYKVRFSGERSGATDTWYGGTTPQDATPVVLADAETKASIDMTVTTGGSISGKVTGTGSTYGYPVAVYDQAGKAVRHVQTDASGNYSAVGLEAGSYKVAFNRSSGFYNDEAQFYSDQPESAGLDQAQSISLAQNQSLQNINAALKPGGSITGTLQDKAGKALPYAYIEAYTRDGSLVSRMGSSDTTGKFSIGGLTTGKYFLRVYRDATRGELYSGNSAEETNATPVSVASGSATTFDLSYAVSPLSAATPTITGTAKVDSTLTAEPGTWEPAPVTLSYQWKADGVAIPGATVATFKPTAATLGKILTISVTGSKGGYTTATRTSAGTAKVSAGTLTAPTPTITGTAAVNSTLTAEPGNWGPAPVALTYQWKADGADITGATASTYKPTTETLGKTLTVTVTGTKDGYTTETKTSAATAKVAAGALTAPVPTISGTAKVDFTLTAVPGTWEPAPVTLKYQWDADGVAITGATATTYKPTAAMVGKSVSVTVTGSKADYPAEARTSAATAKVAAGTLTAPTPTVRGTAKVGQMLTATVGSWGPSPTLKYQWKANGVAITGATAASFKATAAQVGKTMTFSVTGTKAGYTTATKTSAATGTVMALNPVLTAPTPRISGTAKVGYALAAIPGTWGPAPVTLKYQWKANGSAIAGATVSTYKPSAAVVGKTISVTVTGSKAGYNTAAKTSALTARVAVGTLTAPVPKITGTAKVGYTLTAVPGTWGPAPVTLKYQWKANGTAIAGATASTYKPAATVIGKTISVTVTGAKAGYTTAIRTSALTTRVAVGTLTAPVPVISGTVRVGSALTATGAWGPAPVTLKYQWKANGVTITGATASAYTPTPAMLGKTLTVTVTGSKAGFTTVAKTSGVSVKVAAGVLTAPDIPVSGFLTVGSVLTAEPGTWGGPAPVTVTYQWKANGVAIAGATASTYSPTAADVGKYLTLWVTGSKPGYTPAVGVWVATIPVS